MAPIDVLVKAKLFPLKHWLLLLIVNEDIGCGLISNVLVKLSLQPAVEVDTSFTVYDPVAEYVCDGFIAVDVWASPKFQI